MSAINRMLYLIREEVDRAEAKHPDWPDDQIHAAAIVGEEAGELLQAALQWRYEDGEKEAMVTEAIHTAATCVRFLTNLVDTRRGLA